jgi:hypothetical protein
MPKSLSSGVPSFRNRMFAVDDAFLVGGAEGATDLDEDVQRLVRCQDPAHALAQIAPFDVLHGEIHGISGRVDVEDRDDVGVVQGGDDAAFLLEALDLLWIGAARGVQDLEHDGTPERFLDGQIRGRHPAFSDRVANAVALDLHGCDSIGSSGL